MNRRPFAAVLMLGLLAACASPSPAHSKPNLNPNALLVGAIYPLSGPQAEGGQEELRGVRAALVLAKKLGVVRAKDVDLRVIDAQTPEQASAAVDRLIDSYHVKVIIGTYGSTLSAAAAARADERKTIYWETGAVADEVTLHRQNVFRTVATGSTLGRMAATFTAGILMPAEKVQPAEARVVILHTDDTYGRSVAAGEAAEARSLGIRPPSEVAYDPHSYDPVKVADQVLALKPDYLWDVSYLDDGVALWREIKGRHPALRGAVGTSSAFCMPDFQKRLGNDAVDVFAADKPDEVVSAAVLSPAGKSLLAQAIAEYVALGGRRPMSIPAVAGFVGGWTLFHEVLANVPVNPRSEDIRSAAVNVDVPVGDAINGGGVRFALPGEADAGQNRRAVSVVGQWQVGGAMKVVFPPAFATGSPVFTRIP